MKSAEEISQFEKGWKGCYLREISNLLSHYIPLLSFEIGKDMESAKEASQFE